MPSSFSATSEHTTPVFPDVSTPIPTITGVLNLTSLEAGATGASRFANLGYANVTSNVNTSAQNAVSNQQAHSQLNRSVVGKSVNQVSNLGPLEARSSVDVLTNDEMAQALADLRSVLDGFDSGGRPWPVPPIWTALVRLVREILATVAAIEKQNAQLRGTGTSTDPYSTVGDQMLYVLAPVSLVFVDVAPDDLHLNQEIHGTKV